MANVPCSHAQIVWSHYLRHRVRPLGLEVAFCGEPHTVFCVRAGDWLCSDFSRVFGLSCFIWNCHGWSVQQCSSHCTRGLSDRSTRDYVWYPATGLCLWLPTCDSVLSGIGQYHFSWMEATLLVFCWPASLDHNWPVIPPRDDGFSAAPTTTKRTWKYSHYNIHSRGERRYQKPRTDIYLSISLCGRNQLHGEQSRYESYGQLTNICRQSHGSQDLYPIMLKVQY